MELFELAWRTLFFYFFLLVSLRIMGKREVGELSLLDFIVSIMIAEFAVMAIDEQSLIKGVLPIVVLACTQIFLAYVSLKSDRLRDCLDGEPTMIIENGKIDEKAMRQQRYNFDDLLLQLRKQSISNFSEIEFAVLEPSGDLSVIKKETNAGEVVYPFPFIIDGVIQHDHLQRIDKDAEWLIAKLQARGYSDVKDVALCTGKKNGTLIIDEKETNYRKKD
ncbi:uncharacterized membrane protein YcaP (DUF421 family) [Geomicrobium halophilum]|uniref:Uncharacterized membrane protein YcaP (DUF421 family) n=1 Tax=Geomicrobium halophilum TaxID=549000 RepID=A0A841Q179_9BACL|nr:DUF421 domain-containing protein [Geomicrobium halophilum]MBB6449508.1 uncharacterized membrane protein YcaP (DUF421 family) [Geomicrobium halophilum]